MGQIDKEQASKRAAKRAKRKSEVKRINIASLDTEVLVYALLWAIQAGGAIRIGATRDGGAWAFGIYGDGEQPYTEYIRGDEDVNEYLSDLGKFFEESARGS